MKNIITVGTVFAFTILLLAYYFRNTEDELNVRLKKVLSGLMTTDQRQENFNPRIAVAYGSCTDMVVDARKIFNFDHLVNNCDQDVEDINSYEELIKSYAYYFKHGAAAERFTPNGTLFDELVSKFENICPQINMGGNAASIAKRFAMEGFDVLLATSMTEESKKLLPENMNIVGEVTSHDDIHLVFEYKFEEQWGSLIAPRANRFILHHDYHNPRLSSLKRFGSKLRTFRPHLLVVCGLQMMDKSPISEATRYEIFQSVNAQMQSLPHFTKVHFEMASITEKSLLTQILDLVVPFSDSLGMNEQELANIDSLLRYKTVTLATDSNPRVSKTLDMMRNIFRYLRSLHNTTSSTRPLTRLHVHTLAYQLIIVSKNSGWKNTHVAAARASLVANTYVCGTPEVDIERAMLVMDHSFSVSATPDSPRIFLDDHKPVACWDENDYHICIAPNLVCTNAKQTAGCGDNISAAGLAAQL